MDQNFVAQGSTQGFMEKVYGWMSVALVVTAAVAYYVASHIELLLYFALPTTAAAVVGFIQLLLVLYLNMRINSMSYTAAVTSLMIYSALTGLSISLILAVFTAGSIYLAFGVTAGMFFSMAGYGYFTKSDLSGMGTFLFMSLFGLVIAGFLNLFFESPMIQWIFSVGAVLVFTLMTAFDVQKIKKLGQSGAMDPDMRDKMALIGALTLYLDFINIFINIVMLLGKPRR